MQGIPPNLNPFLKLVPNMPLPFWRPQGFGSLAGFHVVHIGLLNLPSPKSVLNSLPGHRGGHCIALLLFHRVPCHSFFHSIRHSFPQFHPTDWLQNKHITPFYFNGFLMLVTPSLLYFQNGVRPALLKPALWIPSLHGEVQDRPPSPYSTTFLFLMPGDGIHHSFLQMFQSTGYHSGW